MSAISALKKCNETLALCQSYNSLYPFHQFQITARNTFTGLDRSEILPASDSMTAQNEFIKKFGRIYTITSCVQLI
jgi:hypothetical protein